MSRIIGLDHGSRRIGVAVADTQLGMAFARPALVRRSLERDVRALADLAAEERAEVIVVGLPLHADGAEGQQAAAARRFGAELQSRGLSVAYEDERLTTWAAGEQLRESGRTPDRRSGERDSAAARLILQQYLDARRPPGRAEEPE